MTRGPYALAIGLALVSAGFAETGTFSYFSPTAGSVAAADSAVTREQEWIVSEIAGSMLDIAAYAGRFEPGDPFQVRSIASEPNGPQRFRLTRRVEEYTVATDQPFTPGAYVRMARSLMADGAGLSVTEDFSSDHVETAGPQAVSRLLQEHPRSAAVHERAALLIGLSVQKRAVAAPGLDARPALCRVTAHLAIARALHPASESKDGRAAAQLLATLAGNQPVHTAAPANLDRPQFWVIEQ